MDRDFTPSQRRSRNLKKVLPWLAGVLVIVVAWTWLRKALSPHVNRHHIRTATIEEGPIEATITASGLVVAESEQVIASPIDSRVLKVLVQPGHRVAKGDPLLILDTSGQQLELDNIGRNMVLKTKQREGKELALQKALIDLAGQKELKTIDLESYRAKVDRYEKLFDLGLISQEEKYEAGLQVKRAEIELRQMERAAANLKETTRAEIEGIELEIQILERERLQKERLLALAGVRADRQGVITQVVDKEGTNVNRGDVLARIADLGQFKVEATVSDVYAGRLREGLAARVEMDETLLPGRLETILPTIEDGIVKLLIRLDDPSHPGMRANLRVDAFLVTENRGRALRVRKGPFANGSGLQDVFVIRADKAYKTKVELGMSSFEYLEVVTGLQEGEEIIISDMSRFSHLNVINVN